MIFDFLQNSRCTAAITATNESTPHLDTFHWIWTKSGMDILVDPRSRNKSVKEFSFRHF